MQSYKATLTDLRNQIKQVIENETYKKYTDILTVILNYSYSTTIPTQSTSSSKPIEQIRTT